MSDHTPGCMYQARCLTCGWLSGIGDSDNAFHQAWDHKADTKVVSGWNEYEGRETPTYSFHVTETVETNHWEGSQ